LRLHDLAAGEATLALEVLIIALAFGYLLGSISFGILVTKTAGVDLRSIGSGNIGATNVLRTGRKDLAAATLLLDGLKGTIAVLIASKWGLHAGIAAAVGAFLGHLFPVWLKFKGGKGVATFLGCLLGFSWQAALFFVVVWLLVAAATRYSSLAAIFAASCTPAFILYSGRVELAALFLLLGVLLIYMHRENVARLYAGTESKIGQPT
jgi:glycerol-3-phosphate acyltransferase PlsY